VPTGHLLYVYGGTLFAVPFDLRRLAVTGGRVPVVEGVRRSTGTTGTAQFSFSNNGSLVYVPGSATAAELQLVLTTTDRKGNVELLKVPPGAYAAPRVSPDGKSLAVGLEDEREAAIWIYELSGATSMRKLTVGGANRFPVWTHDGKRIAFQSDHEGGRVIFWQAADGSGPAERLTIGEAAGFQIPDSWSPDDKVLSYTASQGPELTIHTFSLPDRKDTVLAEAVSSVGAYGSVFSPDGKFIAYSSAETGQNEIWVQPFPGRGARYQVSKDGAFWPFWSKDGRELFFNSRANGLVAVGITTQPSITFMLPAPVPVRFFTQQPTTPRNIDIFPDGTRFISVVLADQAGTPAAQQIQVVLNWLEELKQRVPVK